jgi:dienelactone hydrolase
MKFLKSYLLAGLVMLTTPAAFAQPPQVVAELIARTYNPSVSSSEKIVSGLFDVCSKTAVEITAQDPVTLQPGKILIKMYSRKGTIPTDLKTVIVMPPTGGENALDRGYAGTLCASGFRVALVEHWDSDTVAELDMDMHDRGALRALAAVRHVVAYLNPKRAGQLGILGTSVGAITSAMVLGAEPRISAGVLIVGGGGMVDVISASHEETLTKLREGRMKKFGFATQEDYKKALAPHIHIEPLDFIGDSGPKKVLMMVALKDVTVPTKNQYDLYHAFGDQELLTHDSDHIGTILYTYITEQVKILRFLDANLK